MLQALRNQLIENEQPVGIKKVSNWKLPPQDHAYGLANPKDKEGVGIVTRSWKIHNPSNTHQAPQDFIRINKMAIRMNATNYETNKDFRKSVDIKMRQPHGSMVRALSLPPTDFVYGMPNRVPTPVKAVINHGYGKQAKEIIQKEYDAFMKEKAMMNRYVPQTTTHYAKMLETRRAPQYTEKPLYKLKMFQDVGSKVTEGIRNFKTYQPMRNSMDDLIHKVQSEIDEQGKGY